MKERGVVYMLLVMWIHRRRRVELLSTRGHHSLWHSGSALARQRVGGHRAWSRRLVGERGSTTSTLVHSASAASVSSKVLVVGRVAHRLTVVLGIEVGVAASAASTALVTTSSRTMTVVVAVSRCLGVSPAMRHRHRVLRYGRLVHLALERVSISMMAELRTSKIW